MQDKFHSAIFIVGNSRSGTSVMARVLGNHPQIFTIVHEIHFFEELISAEKLHATMSSNVARKLYAEMLAVINIGYHSKKDRLSFLPEAANREKAIFPRTPANIYKDFLKYSTRKQKKQIPLEQTPRYLFYLKEIFEIFPDARVINMIRDPRDILLSQKNKWRVRFLGHKNIPLKESLRCWANYHPLLMSKLWQASINEYEKWANDKRVMMVQFEKFLQDPVRLIKSVCDFISIEYFQDMLKVHEIGSSIDRYSPSKIGIDKAKMQRWKLKGLRKSEIFICDTINRNRIDRYGYEPALMKVRLLDLLMETTVLPLKLILSFILNIGRFKNYKEALIRRFML